MCGAVNISSTESPFNSTVNSADVYGGAIYASGTVTLGSSNTITGNKAADGGAIYLPDSSSAVLNITGATTFSQNVASGNGGAIFAERNAAINATASATFSENDAVNGGALWIRAGTQLSGFNAGAEFSGNTAEYGGAIYVAITNTSTLTLSTSTPFTFTNNEADYDGGAIYTVQADVVITGQDITARNTAGEGGGFVHSGGTVTISDSTINNQTAQWGGAIYATGAVTVNASHFSGNTTTTETKADLGGGGAIYASGGLNIASSDFTGNQSTSPNANQGGGAVYISGDVAVITGSTFENNTHTNNTSETNGGGAIYANGGSLTIEQSRFLSNGAAGSGASRGGAMYADASTVIITDSYFQTNRAVSNGGAIVFAGACNSTLDQVTFLENVSTGAYGGAIYAQGSLTLTNDYFASNRSANSGGAIYYNQRNNASIPGTFTSTSTMYTLNVAGSAPSSGQGGALYLQADVVLINRNTFDSNQSATSNGESRGGAVYVDTSESASATTSSIRNSVFYNNQVSGGSSNYGGAMYTTGDITVNSCTFAKNASVERAGGVYVGSGTLTIVATILVGNTAGNGRDVYSEGTITSRGYNRVGVYGKGGTDTSWKADVSVSTTDQESSAWTIATFFGEDAELVMTDKHNYNTAPKIGCNLLDKVYLLALVLDEADDLAIADRATNQIPFGNRYTLNIDQYDIWEVDRFASGNSISIGAHYSDGSGGNPENPEEGWYDIASITMSGIPNTLKNVGQTASLIAIIHYENGRTAYGVPYDKANLTMNAEEPVVWISSMPRAVSVDKNGNITALRTTGTSTRDPNDSNPSGAKITVRTVRKKPYDGTSSGGVEAEASRWVVITYDWEYMNVSPNYVQYIADYVETLEHDISVAIADVDSSTVTAPTFQRNFAASWNATPKQITDLTTSTPTFDTYTSYNNNDGLTASKKEAVNINFRNRSTGDIFPITYSWTFTGSELKEILGYDMTGRNITSTMADTLFEKLRIAYQTANGTWSVVGGDGVKGSDAMSSGALSLTQSDSGAGIHVELTAYLANVKVSGTDEGPQVISGTGTRKALIVPDGADDGAITGAMWILRGSSSSTPTQPDNNSNITPNSNSDGGSGGGGGCETWSIGLLGLVLLLKRR